MLAIKLSRFGKKKQPTFRLIVLEKSKDPWGDYLENLGHYDPRTKKTTFNAERINHWISKGAKPTDSVHNLLVTCGILKDKKRTATKISNKRKAKMEKETGDKAAAEKAKQEKAEAAKVAAEAAAKAAEAAAESAKAETEATAKAAEEAAKVAEAVPTETPAKSPVVRDPEGSSDPERESVEVAEPVAEPVAEKPAETTPETPAKSPEPVEVAEEKKVE